jgi:hypothetical protein
MAGVRGKSGGRRPGAGRPKRKRTLPAAPGVHASAEVFLRAVVEGREVADPVRVRAAQTLLRYEHAPLRAPPPQAPAKVLQKRALDARDADRIAEFERKAALIRARYANKDKR